jgi:hypothetical protein
MELSVVAKGSDNLVVFLFNLRGELAENQLNGFDYISIRIGNETYTTQSNPDNLFVDSNNNKRLILKIGTVTQLSDGEYPVTIKGYSLTYQNGYVFNSRSIPQLRPLVVA